MRSGPSTLLGSLPRLAALAALAIAALVLRFSNLSARPVMHDESMFAFYAFDAMQKMTSAPPTGPDGKPEPRGPVYTHMPIMHGPTLMLAAGALFAIPALGDSIQTARGMIAAVSLIGLAAMLALWPRRLRWWLAPLVVTSPLLLFWSRFYRDDMLFCSVLALGVLGVSRGATPGKWRAAWAIAGVALMFSLLTIMENALFAYAAGATFGAVWLGSRLLRRFRPGWARALRRLRPQPLSHLRAPAAAPRRAEAAGAQAEVAGQPSVAGASAAAPRPRNLRSLAPWALGTLCGLLLIALVYGFLVGQAPLEVDASPASPLRRALLPLFRASGWANLYASWLYWEGQHSIQRIGGPIHFHLPILATYELPLAVLLYAGMAWDAGLRRARAALYAGSLAAWGALWFVWHRFIGPPAQGASAGVVDRLLDFLHLEPNGSVLVLGALILPMLIWSLLQLLEHRPLAAWLGWWAACSMFQYSVAGEKVPWLAIHIALPMYAMLGWVWAALLRNRPARTFQVFGGLALVGALIGFRADLRFMDERAGDPRERLAFNHTSIPLDSAIKHRLGDWRTQAAQVPQGPQVPTKSRRVLLVDDPRSGGPSWPGFWYFRGCSYATTTEPASMMGQPWDLILGTREAMLPLLAGLDPERWRIHDLSLRDHWWAPWPEEARWQAWLSGGTAGLGSRGPPAAPIASSLRLLWRYYWDRVPWTEPGGFPIVLVEPAR